MMSLWRAVPKLGWAHVRQTCRLLTAFALAGGSAAWLGVPEGYWAIITAVVVMQPDLSHTLEAGRNRVLATLIGAAVGLVLIAARQRGLPAIPLFIAGLVPLAVVAAIWPNMRLAATTLVVVFLIPAGGDPYVRPLLRVGDILLGVLACIAVSVLVFPHERVAAPSS
jgi:uncharacterized membrane protein YccC